MDPSWASRAEAAGSDRSALAAVIEEALAAGAVRWVVAAADRLLALAPGAAESVLLRAAVDVELGDAAAACARLEVFLARRASDAGVWLALARATAAGARDEASLDRARDRGWRALELDRELEAAIYWLAALEGRRKGPAAFVAVLDALVARGSVRATRARAAHAWRDGERDAARAGFERALELGGVATLDGVLHDLSRLDAVDEIIALGSPRYRTDAHGIDTGLTLATALAARGRDDQARAILTALDARATVEERRQLTALGAALAQRATGAADDVAVEAVCWNGPLWSAAGVAGAADRAGAPRWAWLSWADLSMPSRASQVESASARWARAIPILLAERLHETFVVGTVSVLPVLRGRGLYHPTASWELPVVLRLVPSDVAWIVEGELTHRPDTTLHARVRIWQVERRRLAKTLTVRGQDVAELCTAIDGKLRAFAESLRVMRCAARATAVTGAYVDALADVTVAYLRANAVLPATSAWNEGATVDNVVAAIEASTERGAAHRLAAALVLCWRSLGRPIPDALAGHTT